MAPRETENNAQVKFWGDKQRALWCVMVLSVVVNSRSNKTRHFSISSVLFIVVIVISILLTLHFDKLQSKFSQW